MSPLNRTDPAPARLRVAAATPIPAELCTLIEELEPRVQMLLEPELLPPSRFAGDFEGDPSFRRSPEEQERFEALLESADVLYGIPDVSPPALARTASANPGLRWVQTMAAGGGAQVRAAGLSGEQLSRIAFTTSAGVHGAALAEFALLGLLAGAKDLDRLSALAGRREWGERWTMRQLAGQTVLVVGLGGIGRRVAQLLDALGAHVVGVSRSGSAVPGVSRVGRTEALPELVASADSVVVTLPGTAETEGRFDEALFERMRPGTVFVNVGRGTVVDESALVRALASGRIGFAALDVFAVEPLPASSPLWGLPNVILSPHTAALEADQEEKIARLFADNASRLLDGRPLRNRVDTVTFY
jgi:phosphoglycerate dehydrogenase-like enzyme